MTRKQLSAMTDPDSLMGTRETCAFLGHVSKMTLYRWAQNPASGFPLPFRVGQRNFWRRGDVLAFVERMAQARAPVAHFHAPEPQ
jgi:predicted DNA-binding transcriptional regulator AlpA